MNRADDEMRAILTGQICRDNQFCSESGRSQSMANRSSGVQCNSIQSVSIRSRLMDCVSLLTILF